MKSDKQFRAIIDTLPQITWTITNDAQADFFNQRWFDFTGLTYEQTKGYGWQQVIHPDDLQQALVACQAIRESGKAADIETRYKRADGLYCWFLTRLQPIRDKVGEIEFWVGTSTDIDELKQAQQKKDDFISMASHELKTPITLLSASIQMLKKTIDTDITSDKVPLFIDKASQSLARLVRLLDDLVKLSKIQHGQLSLDKTWINLADLVNECCEHVRMAGTHKITVTGDTGLVVCADYARINQVIVNLANNAVKYAPKSNRIDVDIEQDENWAKIAVTDYGIGIEPEKQPYLFDRYFQVDGSGGEFMGLGLGLYISAEIIKRHGGQIGVDSEPGTGSTFWFTLPLGSS